MDFKNFPVYDFLKFDKFSGVPEKRTFPPSSPPSGPKSIIQSAHLITSKLCSITTTVLPQSTKVCSTFSNIFISSK